MWIALDCDGVILDSNEMKCGVFAEILAGYDPVPTAAFLEHQRRSFGTSRYRLIDQFFADYLKQDAQDGERDALLTRFADLCALRYPQQPFTAGAREALGGLCDAGHMLAVVSGSDQAELRGVFDSLDIARFFKGGIFGSPDTKVTHLNRLAEQSGSDRIFVGDALADVRAARETGTRFVGMLGWSSDPAALLEASRTEGFPLLETLGDLRAHIAA
jgi:phosphoglycolate phosphatase-like HAD superfamily hydrolase